MPVIFGCTFNPINFVQWMRENNIKFSLDYVYINRSNIVFSSFFDFNKHKTQLKNKRVFVFDCKEKLRAISGVKIIREDQQVYVHNFLLNNADRGVYEVPEVYLINPIQEIIDENKSIGIMGEYSTLFYKVTRKEVRDDIKALALGYLTEEIDHATLLDLIEKNEKEMRQSKTKQNIQDLFLILAGETFKKLRLATKELMQYKTIVDRTTLEGIACSYGVEPFDLNYFYSVILKRKGKKS